MARSTISSIASPNSSSWSPASSSKSQLDDSESPATTSSSACGGTLKLKGGPIDKRKRLAANARERKRMNLLNKAYDQLRKRLNDAENKSKYDVLVQAKEYIQALAKICADHDRDQAAGSGNIHKVDVATKRAKTHMESEPAGKLAPTNQIDRTQAPQESRSLTIATTRPCYKQPQQLPVQSPSSASSVSDCCLSPMSLPDSVVSSSSSHCSNYHQFNYNQPSYINQHQALLYRAADSTAAAFLLQTSHDNIKREQLFVDEIPRVAEFPTGQIYHHNQHYQSLFQIHAHQQHHQQATL